MLLPYYMQYGTFFTLWKTWSVQAVAAIVADEAALTTLYVKLFAKSLFHTYTPPHLSPSHLPPPLPPPLPLPPIPTTLDAACTGSVGVSITGRSLLALAVTLDYFASLAPFEVIRVEERVHHDDDVHEWGSKEVDEEANKVLDALSHISGKPKADAE